MPVIRLFVCLWLVGTVCPAPGHAGRPEVSEEALKKSELVVVGAKILMATRGIDLVWMKLITLVSSERLRFEKGEPGALTQDTLDGLESVSNYLSDLVAELRSEAEWIIAIPHIMDQYRAAFAKLRLERISIGRESRITLAAGIDFFYAKQPYKSVLSAFGDPRPSIRSTLNLLNEAEQLLKKEASAGR